MPELETNFLRVLQDYTAGDPMREGVRWTNLTLAEIGERVAAAGTPVSRTVVKALLHNHHYVKRKAQKAQAMGPIRTATLSLSTSRSSSRRIWNRRTRW